MRIVRNPFYKFFLFLVILPWGCNPVQQEPLLPEITGLMIEPDKYQVFLEETISLTVNVSDSNNNQLSILWKADGGYFEWDDRKTTNWTAPNSPANVTITVYIAGGISGSIISESITIRVVKPDDPQASPFPTPSPPPEPTPIDVTPCPVSEVLVWSIQDEMISVINGDTGALIKEIHTPSGTKAGGLAFVSDFSGFYLTDGINKKIYYFKDDILETTIERSEAGLSGPYISPSGYFGYFGSFEGGLVLDLNSSSPTFQQINGIPNLQIGDDLVFHPHGGLDFRGW